MYYAPGSNSMNVVLKSVLELRIDACSSASIASSGARPRAADLAQ